MISETVEYSQEFSELVIADLFDRTSEVDDEVLLSDVARWRSEFAEMYRLSCTELSTQRSLMSIGKITKKDFENWKLTAVVNKDRIQRRLTEVKALCGEENKSSQSSRSHVLEDILAELIKIRQVLESDG